MRFFSSYNMPIRFVFNSSITGATLKLSLFLILFILVSSHIHINILSSIIAYYGVDKYCMYHKIISNKFLININAGLHRQPN